MAYRWSIEDASSVSPWLDWLTRRPSVARSIWALYETTASQTPATEQASAPGTFVPTVYLTSPPPPFFTARTRVEPGTPMPAIGSPSAGGAPMEPAPTWLRWVNPAVLFRDARAWFDARPLRTVPAARRAAPDAGPAPAVVEAPRPVMAVIDTDIALLHRAFRRPGTPEATRFLAYWDQTDSESNQAPALPWATPAAMGYGREIESQAIDAALVQVVTNGKSEARVYASLGVDEPPEFGHGTHVLALAAGASDLWPGLPPVDDLDIIAVQLPREAVAHTHGLWLNALLVDALNYVVDKAASLRPGAPLVVNVSMGAYSGPHDSTAMLCRAVDALIEREAGNLTLVVPAGNGRQLRAHARVTLQAGSAAAPASASLAFQVVDGDDTPNFVEFWASAPGDLSGVEVELQAPGPAPSGPLPLSPHPKGKVGVYTFVNDSRPQAGDGPALAVIVAPSPQNGSAGSSPIAFVGVGPGSGSAQAPAAPQGAWTVTLHNHSQTARVFDAWIARDDHVEGHLGVQLTQLSFHDPGNASVTEFGTMSTLAWIRQAIVVGGYEVPDGTDPPQMYDDSACGFGVSTDPQLRRAGPDLCAPASTAAGGFQRVPFISGPLSAQAQRVAGTSLAAPIAARCLAYTLSNLPAMPADRDVLLAALKTRFPMTAVVSPPGRLDWTSDYWLPASV